MKMPFLLISPKIVPKIQLIKKGGCFEYHAVIADKIEYRFPQEVELTAKSQRLAELDAALNMEDSTENRDERSESERPSVLADLKSKAEHIPPAKYSETREEVL